MIVIPMGARNSDSHWLQQHMLAFHFGYSGYGDTNEERHLDRITTHNADHDEQDEEGEGSDINHMHDVTYVIHEQEEITWTT